MGRPRSRSTSSGRQAAGEASGTALDEAAQPLDGAWAATAQAIATAVELLTGGDNLLHQPNPRASAAPNSSAVGGTASRCPRQVAQGPADRAVKRQDAPGYTELDNMYAYVLQRKRFIMRAESAIWPTQRVGTSV
jgi:hypothetical protein